MNYRRPSRGYDFHGRNVAWDAIGDGPPLVVVHGTPWSSYNLRHVISALARSHRVYYHDMPGYGVSDKKAGDVSLGAQNEVLSELLDHWRIDEPVAVGHDIGGATLLRTRLLNGRRFSSLILIDAVAIRPWGSSFFRHVQRFEEAFTGLPAYVHEAIVRRYVETAATRPIRPEVLSETVSAWIGPEAQAAFYRQMAHASEDHTDEVEPRYAEIGEPALVLWGEDDTWLPVERGAALAAALGNGRFATIPGTGHLVIEEKPAALVRAIDGFLRAVKREHP